MRKVRSSHSSSLQVSLKQILSTQSDMRWEKRRTQMRMSGTFVVHTHENW